MDNHTELLEQLTKSQKNLPIVIAVSFPICLLGLWFCEISIIDVIVMILCLNFS